MRRPYTAERAYRWSVLPLGILLMVGGVLLGTAALLMPTDSIVMPPLTDPWLKRVGATTVSLLLIPLGLGFCLRSKVAWWGFFTLELIGTAWYVVAGILDPQYFELTILSPLGGLPILVGIYLATKPAFA